ncbi:hypothetical protein WJX82_000589 [Trebouxia sp. C0006]
MQVQVLKAWIAPQRLTSSKAFSSDFTFRFGYRIWCLRRNALSFWQILFRPNSQAAESVHLYNRKPMAFCTLELIAVPGPRPAHRPEHTNVAMDPAEVLRQAGVSVS